MTHEEQRKQLWLDVYKIEVASENYKPSITADIAVAEFDKRFPSQNDEKKKSQNTVKQESSSTSTSKINLYNY